MNNRECALAVLVSHREARQWSDAAVADDLLVQLGLDATADAPHARPAVDPSLTTEDAVMAAEAAAKLATDRARNARDALNAQAEADAQATADVAHAEAKAEMVMRQSGAGEDPAQPGKPRSR